MVQGTAVWAASPERARYDFHPAIRSRLARPFSVCVKTLAGELHVMRGEEARDEISAL